MPENTVNNRSFDNETEKKLYQELLDMVNNNESEIHEDTFRSMMEKHKNEDVFEEASHLAKSFDLTDLAKEYEATSQLISNLKVASTEEEMVKYLLNDRDKYPNLSKEEYDAKYNEILLQAGIDQATIDSVLQNFNVYLFTIPASSNEPESKEKSVEEEVVEPVIVEDQDQEKKKVGISEENVSKLSNKKGNLKLNELNILIGTIRSNRKYVYKHMSNKQDYDKHKANLNKWNEDVQQFEKEIDAMPLGLQSIYRIKIEQVKRELEKNDSKLAKFDAKLLGNRRDKDGNLIEHTTGTIERKENLKNKWGTIKLAARNLPDAIWIKVLSKFKGIKNQKEAEQEVNQELTQFEKECTKVKEICYKISNHCHTIMTKGIKNGEVTLEGMQEKFDKATSMLNLVNSYDENVKNDKFVKESIDRVTKLYEEMKTSYFEHLSKKGTELETMLSDLHHSIGDDQEHSIDDEKKSLDTIKQIYAVCNTQMTDDAKSKIENQIAQAEAELQNKAVYLKYKTKFEKYESLAKLNMEGAKKNLATALEALKNETFADAIKYKKEDLIASFEAEMNRITGVTVEKKEEKINTPEETKKEQEATVETIEQNHEEKKEEEKPKMTAEQVIDLQTQTIFNRLKQENEKLKKENSQRQEMVSELQEQLASTKATASLEQVKDVDYKELDRKLAVEMKGISENLASVEKDLNDYQGMLAAYQNGDNFKEEIMNNPEYVMYLNTLADDVKEAQINEFANQKARTVNASQIRSMQTKLSQLEQAKNDLQTKQAKIVAQYEIKKIELEEEALNKEAALLAKKRADIDARKQVNKAQLQYLKNYGINSLAQVSDLYKNMEAQPLGLPAPEEEMGGKSL